MAGRGRLSNHFLFGHDLNDYDTLFNEKLDLLLTLQKAVRLTGPVHTDLNLKMQKFS